jgi:hypothetical protein
MDLPPAGLSSCGASTSGFYRASAFCVLSNYLAAIFHGVFYQYWKVWILAARLTAHMDVHCKDHGIENLYVVDGSVVVSRSAVEWPSWAMPYIGPRTMAVKEKNPCPSTMRS